MFRGDGATRTESRGLSWLLVFLVAVVGVGAMIGIACAPDDWYRQLAKAPFNPPDWVFGPVWFALYVFLALSGWLVWMRAPRDRAMVIWMLQMLVNLLWPPTFFVLHMVWTPLALVGAMIVLTAVLFPRARRVDPWAGWCLAPYMAWLIYSAVLNGWVALAN